MLYLKQCQKVTKTLFFDNCREILLSLISQRLYWTRQSMNIAMKKKPTAWSTIWGNNTQCFSISPYPLQLKNLYKKCNMHAEALEFPKLREGSSIGLKGRCSKNLFTWERLQNANYSHIANFFILVSVNNGLKSCFQ